MIKLGVHLNILYTCKQGLSQELETASGINQFMPEDLLDKNGLDLLFF